MQISSKFKTILAANLALLIIACNNDKPKKVKVQEVTLQDIKREDATPEPPPPPPPKVDMELATKRCFANDGLKYKTVVTLFSGENEVAGNVTSEDLETGKKEISKFGGIMKADKLTIKFEGTPPVIGDASEWTGKPWTIKKAGGQETLLIVFNAKNYNTNKWEDTNYQFVQVDCQ
jgi:hypothetical protein